jgi:hypothetical protein
MTQGSDRHRLTAITVKTGLRDMPMGAVACQERTLRATAVNLRRRMPDRASMCRLR